MLHVQEYLLTHTLKQLSENHGVNAHVQDHKASFNYDQILAKNSDPLACQCRGLILSTPTGCPFPEQDVVGATKILARPFDRFFNCGQQEAAEINMATARIYEKLDGSLIILYYDTVMHKWCVATRSVPNGDNTIHGGIRTFREMFEMATGKELVEYCIYLNDDFTYLFELTGPLNRMVVQYDIPEVTLLGMRVSDSEGHEMFPDPKGLWNVNLPQVYTAQNLEAVVKLAGTLDPKEQEGFVVVSKGPRGFSRVKIKAESYVAAHRLVSTAQASPRNLAKLLILGKSDDVAHIISGVFQEMLTGMTEKLQQWVKTTDTKIMLGLAAEDKSRKTFVLYCQSQNIWLGPAMAIFDKKSTDSMAWLRSRELTDSFLDTVMREIGFRAKDYV